MGRNQKAQSSGNPSVHGPNMDERLISLRQRSPSRCLLASIRILMLLHKGSPSIPMLCLRCCKRGLPGELLEEVRRRIPVPKPPEKKKERALADLRDKLDKERKHLERLEARAQKKTTRS